VRNLLQQTVNAATRNYTLDLNTGLTQVLADGTNTYLYGNGRIADQGVNMLLTWNLPYFLKTCTDTLDDDPCASGNGSLTDGQQAMLRGVALSDIGTDAEIALIAQMLKAACSQVAQIADNILTPTPGDYLTYPDLWALTLALRREQYLQIAGV